MNTEHLIQDIASLGLNLYDFALYTPEGMFTHRFQPCNNCANSYSVAKLFVVTALGMLWDEGKIRMDDPLSLYFAIPQNADPRWHTATIENIEYTQGDTLAVGIYVKCAGANAWGKIDDAKLNMATEE